MKKPTKQNITYGIYSILLLLVIGIWILEILQFDDALSNMWNWENRYDFANVIYSLKIINPFGASLFSLFLLAGLFIKNRVGWILVTGWFYFGFWNFCGTLVEEKIESISIFLQLVLIIAIPILFIILMNRFNGISDYHQLEKKNKLTLNLWSAGVGLILAVLLFAKKNMLHQYL